MTKAEEFETETKSRAEELKAMADAKKAIVETTSGADKISYGLDQVSLLQEGRSSLASGVDLANFEAMRIVRAIATKQNSPVLAQLVERMRTAMRMGAKGTEDKFAKV